MHNLESEAGSRTAVWIAVVIAIDQTAKYLAKENLTVIENSALPFGISFGVFNLPVVAAALLLFVFLSRKYLASSTAMGLIIGGALSNLIDRLPDGRVTDFINLGIGNINIADAAVYAGIILLSVELCFKRSIQPQL